MLAQLVKSSIQTSTYRLNCSAMANQSVSEPLKVLAKEKINFKFRPLYVPTFVHTDLINCNVTANQGASEPLKVLAKEKINFKFRPFMQKTKHYFHNNAYNGVSCSIFHITVKVCIFSLLEFTRCFAVKYWWVLHGSYITYIRHHYMTRSFDSISLNLALRFIFILQILFACALCFIPFFIITGSILSLLS